MEKKRGLAAYDIDGTLLSPSIFDRAFWLMEEKGLIEDSEKILDDIRSQRNDQPKSEAYIWGMVEHYTQFTRGMNLEDMRLIAEELAEEEVTNIYPEMQERLDQDQEDNLRTVLITGTPTQLLKPFARRLDCDLYFGSKYYEADGKIHHARETVSRGVPDQKRKLLGKTAAITGLGVERAYGDSGSDLPMLEMAVGAYAVNPTDGLREIALERDWEIIDCDETAH